MDERKKIEKALMELKFIDEPDLDVGLLAIKSTSGCLKDCLKHCAGQKDDCKNNQWCEGKCLLRGDCGKQSEKWCSHQTDECDHKICRGKCMARGVF